MKKKMLIICILVLSFMIYRLFFYTPKMYMYGNPYLRGWDKRKIEIPQEIVKAKDCAAFKKYADEKMGPDFIFSAGCPWAKIEPVGHFILNGITFNVPRTYLWQGGRDPDGLSEGLHTMMRYPNFDATDGNDDLDIRVTIAPEKKEKYLFDKKIWVNCSQGWYLRTSGVEHRIDEFLANKNLNQYIVDAPEIGMKKYIIKQALGMVYFQGNIINPNYWIICAGEGDHTRCESSFMYKGNNFVSYSFRRKGLVEYHKEIRNKIKEQLDEFTHIGEENDTKR